MAANAAVDALQDELVALTCEEQKGFTLQKATTLRVHRAGAAILTATQRAALAASEKYAREELVKTGEIVWRVTWLSQSGRGPHALDGAAARLRAVCVGRASSSCIDSDTRGLRRQPDLLRYWQGLSLFVVNAPALSVLRMRKPWRASRRSCSQRLRAVRPCGSKLHPLTSDRQMILANRRMSGGARVDFVLKTGALK